MMKQDEGLKRPPILPSPFHLYWKKNYGEKLPVDSTILGVPLLESIPFFLLTRHEQLYVMTLFSLRSIYKACVQYL